MTTRTLLLVFAVGCAAVDSSNSQPATITHVFDYAANGPQRLSIMFTMAWFGIPASDPQTPGGMDPSYHNWDAGGTPCALVTPNPTAADTCVLMGQNNGCVANDPSARTHRRISSRRRPLTGPWSGTGRDVESQRKLDLMLAMVRRPGCRADDGARLDAWTMQNNSIKFSSKYVTNPGNAADLPYRTMLALFARADAAKIPGAVMPGFDSTWYFHFGGSVGLTSRQAIIDAITEDLRDLATEAAQHPSAVTVNGKPVLFVYTDHWQASDQGHGGNQPSATEWATIFGNARNLAHLDFYVVGVSDGYDSFAAFDALAPWTGNSLYVVQPGRGVYGDSFAQTRARHQALIDHVAQFPGRLVYGGVVPGFDDWTRNWSGPCTERQMPPGSPRDPALLTAQADFFSGCKHGTACTSATAAYDFRGFLGETWDDWTEGSEFEPDVHDGPARLVQLRQLIGQVFGDQLPDAAGDARLAARWTTYGEARNGLGGAAGASPVTNLACDGTTLDFHAPANDSAQAARIHVHATAQTATAMQVYVDDVPAGSATGEVLDLDVGPYPVGAHRVGVKAWNGAAAGPIEEHYVTVVPDAIVETMPADGEATSTAVHVLARDNTPKTVTAMQIYLDSVLAATGSFDTVLPVGAGSHRIAVKSWYSDGTNLFTEHAVTASAALVEVRPRSGATVHAPVFVQASDASGSAPVAMQVYLDDVMVAQTMATATLETHVAATAGTHRFAVKSWYANGTSRLSAQAIVNVQ
jgi:hypothetical protein